MVTETSSDCIFPSLSHCLCRYFRRFLIISGSQEFKENEKTFKFDRHVSTEPATILSCLMQKALEVEFVIEKC